MVRDWSGGIYFVTSLIFSFQLLYLKGKGVLVPSSDILQTGRAFSQTTHFLKKMKGLSERINEAIRLTDPEFHQSLLQLREAALKKHPIFEALNAIDPLLLEGRELLFNRLSGIHRDSLDPILGWAGLYAAGYYTSGGYLYIPPLKLRIRFQPGDFVLIRGRVVEHAIQEWSGGQRISIPHFTHTSLWRDCGLEHLVDPFLSEKPPRKRRRL